MYLHTYLITFVIYFFRTSAVAEAEAKFHSNSSVVISRYYYYYLADCRPLGPHRIWLLLSLGNYNFTKYYPMSFTGLYTNSHLNRSSSFEAYLKQTNNKIFLLYIISVENKRTRDKYPPQQENARNVTISSLMLCPGACNWHASKVPVPSVASSA